jgi:hypothetical protein
VDPKTTQMNQKGAPLEPRGRRGVSKGCREPLYNFSLFLYRARGESMAAQMEANCADVDSQKTQMNQKGAQIEPKGCR